MKFCKFWLDTEPTSLLQHPVNCFPHAVIICLNVTIRQMCSNHFCDSTETHTEMTSLWTRFLESRMIHSKSNSSYFSVSPVSFSGSETVSFGPQFPPLFEHQHLRVESVTILPPTLPSVIRAALMHRRRNSKRPFPESTFMQLQLA